MKFYDALTDFIFTEQKPEKADAIFVPGGLYGEIAQHAAELYQQGFASLSCLLESTALWKENLLRYSHRRNIKADILRQKVIF